MQVDSMQFRGHPPFKNDWVGFDPVKPVNVIIGRNNTGKSHLLDLAEALCENKLKDRGWTYRCSGVLVESELMRAFPSGTRGGDLQENFWDYHGRHFVGQRVIWETSENMYPVTVSFEGSFSHESPFGTASTNARLERVRGLLQSFTHTLTGRKFRRLLADRDIRPEVSTKNLALAADGTGASNIIRRFILTSESKYSRGLIQRELLDALNKIFGPDGEFTEIQIKTHDEKAGTANEERWEIFLGEAKKGLIPLSDSGSGLKTVFLVLLNLLVIPQIEDHRKKRYVFAFEELENNLHPALTRRLLRYIEDYAVTEKAVVFLTTHSSAALDLFGVSRHAQIIHVTHDGESARATTVSAHFDKLGVISELGAKASDLLQANGIIWVEGPSDRIYINRWIELYTDGRLREGRDYQCAFYGGALLARAQFTSPEDEAKELVNLLHVNPNIVAVCDGDRTSQRAPLKPRVSRIQAEVAKIPGAHSWVTGAREIENYIPGIVLANAMDFKELPDPTQFDLFFPSERGKGSSYLESYLKRKCVDKMELAALCVPHMTRELMSGRFEWESQIKRIVERIDAWNR